MKNIKFILLGMVLYPVIFRLINAISVSQFNLYVGYLGLGF